MRWLYGRARWRWRWATTAALAGGTLLCVGPFARDGGASAQSGLSVVVREAPPLGRVLTDPAGFTLYTFDQDLAGSSSCVDACAETWPPLLHGEGDPVVGAALRTAVFPLVRPDGRRQLALAGKALYRFSGDQQPGEMRGDGVGGVWHAATVTAPVDGAPTPAPALLPTAPTPAPVERPVYESGGY